MIFRRLGEAMDADCLRLSFKSQRVNIMIWGCFAWNRLDPLIVCESRGIESEEYIEILSKGLLSFVNDLLGSEEETVVRVRQLSDITFMQDGASCHRNAEMTSFLAEKKIKMIS